MKVLVFNDTHLSNRFDKELFDYIANLIKKADKVIINGDFWDGYVVTFDSFINSKWSKLFPLLRKKDCVYITGNHDKFDFMDERVSLISSRVVNAYTYSDGENTFHFQHGNIIAPTHDKYRLFHNPNNIRFIYSIFANWYLRLDRFIKIYAAYEYFKAVQQLTAFKKYVQKKKSQEPKHKESYYIFGHSHLHRIFPKEKIISVGALQKHKKNYLFITDGKLRPHPQLTYEK